VGASRKSLTPAADVGILPRRCGEVGEKETFAALRGVIPPTRRPLIAEARL